ncbi:phosphonate metabolism transcriptional regulator PhnF [Aureimonas endophytica]|uniref:Phosphonate metabolism transcriptional regulator PhnF n=1 Tax=Aureimonas endophytica TaxID=2027858 RepID=A0A916ZH76_9HYPH|nr:phosphonate metabolism transcriptional regulator PhnF [Aureimonas endophytica]GGD97814.1 phosphonate metabolism transcriptional regulator PhnF [Aureimonas endophytica]
MIGGEDGIARWRSVADGIRGMIAEAGGALERLPVEAELAARFGVNRHTVRRAIAALAAEGLLRAERGRGTFVAARPPRLSYPVGPRTRFSENVARAARRPGGRLIRADLVPADAALAGLLDLRPGAPLHRLETLSVADGVPLSVGTGWFPAERFPAIVAAYAETGSITLALKAHGIEDYRRRETRVTAERLSPADAELLASPPDGLALVSHGVDVDLGGCPIQANRTRAHADRVELVFDHAPPPREAG